MLTITTLKDFGADTDEGLGRCLGNEELYFKLVRMIPDDANFEGLKEAVSAGDLDKAFEHAHALKGVLANLSLTPIAEKASEITELLRARTEMDYTELLDELSALREELVNILDEE